jgi:hypothetical protein
MASCFEHNVCLSGIFFNPIPAIDWRNAHPDNATGLHAEQDVYFTKYTNICTGLKHYIVELIAYTLLPIGASHDTEMNNNYSLHSKL